MEIDPCSHEDRDHILKCHAQRQVTWRIEVMESLSDICRNTQTDSEVQTLLRICMEQYFSTPGNDIQLNPEEFSPNLQQIIQHQNRIGWRQIFNGRFATPWSRVQQAAYKTRRPRSGNNQIPIKRTVAKWQVQLIVHV